MSDEENRIQHVILGGPALPTKVPELSYCAVCFDAFNKSTRSPTACPSCNVRLCRGCLQTYLLNDILDAPRCINTECTNVWDREFLDGELTRTFRLSTYKDYREKVLLDRERARLPETQEQAAAYRTALEEKPRLKARMVDLQEQIRRLEYELAEAEVAHRRAVIRVRSYGFTDGEDAARGAAAAAAAAPAPAPVQFVKQCPAEGCRGFLSTAWKCGLCNLWSCPTCHELKGASRDDPGHVCDADKVASVRLISRETRPCPKCAAAISKISGCDQMWCTACNTGFNWRTGQIATGAIHNPHYFEWRQRTGAAADGAGAGAGAGAAGAGAPPPCDGDDAIFRAIDPLARARRHRWQPRYSGPVEGFLFETLRMILELEDDHAYNREYTREYTDADVIQTHRRLRVQFLTGEISEDKWRTQLQQYEKLVRRKRSIRQVKQVFIDAGRDILRQLLRDVAPLQAAPVKNKDAILAHMEPIKRQIEDLLTYCNGCLEKIEKHYGCKVRRIVIEAEPELR
jgi:hypothetical protein